MNIGLLCSISLRKLGIGFINSWSMAKLTRRNKFPSSKKIKSSKDPNSQPLLPSMFKPFLHGRKSSISNTRLIKIRERRKSRSKYQAKSGSWGRRKKRLRMTLTRTKMTILRRRSRKDPGRNQKTSCSMGDLMSKSTNSNKECMS